MTELFFRTLPRYIMIAGSYTVRIMTIIMFLLSVSPLASIYIVWCTFETKQTTLLEIVNNPNTTLEELWAVLFPDEPYNYEMIRANHQGLLEVLNQAQSIHGFRHLRVVVPWFLTFICGVFIPIILTMRGRRRRGQQYSWNAKLENKYKKLFRKQLDTCSVSLEEMHRMNDGWEIEGRAISEPCTICLQRFLLYDIASVSSTCCHVFHRDCIISWMLQTVGKGHTPGCPLCRRPFLDSVPPVPPSATPS